MTLLFLRAAARVLAAALLLPATSFAAEALASMPPAHDIRVRIDPQTRALEGQDTITLASGQAQTLLLSTRFNLTSLRVDGKAISPDLSVRNDLQHIRLPRARAVTLQWRGELAALDTAMDHRATLTASAPVTGAAGTYLPAGSGWYPMVSGRLETHRVTIDLPAGQRGLVPGRLLQEQETADRYEASYEFEHPAEGIALMAGPYRVEERKIRTQAGSAVRLRTWFHAELAPLATGYLDSVKDYLDLYERKIGAYPFTEFSIVSSPTPTGFGMPTLTYLGIDVLKLPFIRATSLGHEVLHNWWGNGVYPDYARGNWSEGLTTFMADYAYRERDGVQAASAMRLAWLRDYASMPTGDDLPLARFTSRTHGASQIVGYHKAAMLFFMLRDLIGEAAFDAGLQRFWREQQFRVAGWAQLRTAFEAALGRDLKSFFAQWTERAGAPELRIADARVDRIGIGAGWRVSVTLAQSARPFPVLVPLTLRTAGGESVTRMSLRQARETFTLETPQEPIEVVLDAEFRVFRRLAAGEAPPILRAVMLARDVAMPAINSDAKVRSAARALAAELLEQPPRLLKESERPVDNTGADALLVIGLHADVDRWLAREGLPVRPEQAAATRGSAQVWMLQGDVARKPAAIALISAADIQALTALMRPLPHYGQQSFATFDGSRVMERGIWPGRPQAWRLARP